MSDPLATLADSLDPASQIELLSALAARIASAGRPQIIGREVAAVVDDRARYPLAVPQWMTAEMQPRGVIIQALSFADIEAAEKAATEKRAGARPGDPPEYMVNEFRQILHETSRGIVEPAGLTPATLSRWNYDSIAYIHRAIRRIGPTPAALIGAELARLAGGPPPAPVSPPHPRQRGADADELGDDAEAAAAVPDDLADDSGPV